MILSQKTIQEIKDKTGMTFDRAKDFSILAEDIFEKTGRTIGITTLKRLFGTIEDERDAIGYTMNTIAIYLGYPSWKAYMGQDSFDSEWGYDDETFFIHLLEPGDQLKVQYLDRQVDFKVIDRSDGREIRRVLRVDGIKNSSLQLGDIVYVYRLSVGAPIEAEKVVRDGVIGNYRTKGEVTNIEYIPAE